MPVPTVHIEINGSILALYGAVVATATAVVQTVGFLRDRASVKVIVQHNMEIVGHPAYAGLTLTILKAVNIGRRPVTITSMGAYRVHPGKALVCVDTLPALPCELAEGKYVQAFIKQNDLDLENIESWQAWDAVGRCFKLNVAPWYKRWRSARLRKKFAKHGETTTATTPKGNA